MLLLTAVKMLSDFKEWMPMFNIKVVKEIMENLVLCKDIYEMIEKVGLLA